MENGEPDGCHNPSFHGMVWVHLQKAQNMEQASDLRPDVVKATSKLKRSSFPSSAAQVDLNAATAAAAAAA